MTRISFNRSVNIYLLMLGMAATFFISCEEDEHRPMVGEWEVAVTFSQDLREHRSLVLTDGTILMTGGAERLNHVFLFDPVSRRLESRAPMQLGRESHAIVPLPDGKIMVMGGFPERSAGHITATTEIYDPVSDSWRYGTPMTMPRAAFTATVLTDGSIVVTGGFSGEHSSTETCERYFPAQDRWERIADLERPRHGHKAISLNNDRIFVISGSNRFYNGEIYLSTEDRWIPTSSPEFAFRPLGTSAVKLSEDEILVTLRDSVQIYYPASDRWQTVTPMVETRGSTEFVVLPDGWFLAVGGQGPVDLLSSFYQVPDEVLTCEFFNPKEQRWTNGPVLNRPKFSHSLHRLGNRLIAIGGDEIEILELR